MSDFNKPTSAGIYSHASAVTNETANKIGDYRGPASFSITTEQVEWRGQSLFVQESAIISYGFAMNFGEVTFIPATFGTLYGITATSGSTKEATPANATLYQFNTSLAEVTAREFLIDATQHSDSKQIQIWAANAKIVGDVSAAFSQTDFVAHDVGLALYPDASDEILHIIRES